MPFRGDNEYIIELKELAEHNVNPVSYLATDYINHFSEILIALEMLPQMICVLEDIEHWKPLSYRDHILRSNMANKELILAAYALSPRVYRIPFDATIDRMHMTLTHAFQHIDQISEDQELLPDYVTDLLDKMRPMVNKLSSIINGRLHYEH